ncbi:MAG TPA: UDP-N-acetylmuramoyl-tripeptide--D-alanyl-D-alanine ligase [Bryobacteraceae bacterium]|jgi:UDP-N-acetylmuramoyl-tripeptide--D-alanyl-D-alanine ligase|nr:UDP-N-acetylmuramoyl-tripeptide--D-alanyl-D-alanine ligase [Bryobacteraceae bacterium]
MVEFTVQEIGAVIGIRAEFGARTPIDARITGWSVDSRTVAPGDLFFALRGPNHDGNAYVADALRKGAIAAIVDENADARENDPPRLVVPDSLVALQKIAAWARNQWNGEVVGVTGSAGKTSTKDVIAEMLCVKMPAGKTIGNFNNHVGVPLSILRLPAKARVAVLEIGMNHAGEIRELSAIARPRIGVVTNVGHAHMEAFDSIEGVAAAKRELIEALPGDGVAVLNADDPLVTKFRKVHPGRTITFGLNEGADFRGQQVELTTEGVRFQVNGVRFESPLLGRHSILNLLAGIAVASLYDIRPEQLRDVIEKLSAGSMRGQRFIHNDILILNDCYNSNPDAARAMIDVLRETPAKRRIAVLGEMLELGRWAESLHRDVGRYVANCGIDVLVGIRGEARHLVDAAKEAGQAVDAAFFSPDTTAAGDRLRQIARAGDVILFKGSRGTHVEQALERFLARPN